MSGEKIDRRKLVKTPEQKAVMLANLVKAREARDAKIRRAAEQEAELDAQYPIPPSYRIEEEGRAANNRSRGRPAFREETAPMPIAGAPEITADMTPEQVIDALGDGSALTRESRVGITAAFDIPERGKRAGWDYQWWPTHYVGEEVDPSYQVEIARGSWFPTPASHFPQLCPPGWKRQTIDREGMRLYMRPMRLTVEAREESSQMAYRQKMDRLAAAQAGDAGRDFARRVNPDGSSAISIDIGVKPLI